MASSLSAGRRGTTVGERARSLHLPGIVLGVGLGGFVDGIALHQLLPWHHMLISTNHDRIGVKYYPANTVSGLQMNTVWDGIFHAICWVAVLAGLAVLYGRVTRHRRRAWTSAALWGWILVGWGLFNLVEGILDHHVLGIHHVYAGEQQLWWDLGFLLLGALLVAVTCAPRRAARKARTPVPVQTSRTSVSGPMPSRRMTAPRTLLSA